MKKMLPSQTLPRIRFAFLFIFRKAYAQLPVFVTGLLFLLLSAACKPEPETVSPDQPDTATDAGAVTPVGSPEGSVVTVNIGPAGGTIESADRRLRVNIPAGALTDNQNISLQPLRQNHCPLGTGQAFRLLPHGLTFNKPATLTIGYDSRDVNGSAPEALRIAFQTDKGYWQSPKTKKIDTTARTISVQTTHFSDWGLFQTMHLDPGQAFLNPGTHQRMQVSMIPFDDDKTDLAVPLSMLMPTKYVEKWTLHGAGTLSHRHNTGDYYAPETIPATNPVSVTVFLNKSVTIDGQVFKDIRLVSNICVAPEGISFQVGKNEWRTFPGGANINSTQHVIAGAVGSEHIQVGWVGNATGTYPWTEGTAVGFVYVNGPFLRSHMYFKVVSGGVLRVDNQHPEWVTGTFTLTNAGWYDTGSAPPIHGTTAIQGVFRIKRV